MNIYWTSYISFNKMTIAAIIIIIIKLKLYKSYEFCVKSGMAVSVQKP